MPNYTRHEEINHANELIAELDSVKDSLEIADLKDRLKVLQIKNTRHTISRPQPHKKPVQLSNYR